MARRDTKASSSSAKKPTKAQKDKRRRSTVASKLTPVADGSPAKDKRWYASGEKPHEAVYDIARLLLQDGSRSKARFYRQLYLDEARGLQQGYQYPNILARFNVVRNICETLLARSGKHQPAPMIHTVGGEWKVQRRTRAMVRFIGGDWERLKADRMRRDALLDCLVTGVGAIKVHPNQGRVAWARTRGEDILKHPREVKAGHVRTIYQVAAVDREVLAAEYPECREEILEGCIRAPHEVLEGSEDENDDLVLVIEAWHLPHSMTDDGKFFGGRHCIVVDGCTLWDAEWKRDSFPIVELHMTGDTMGRSGVGYAERLAGLQAAQNRLSETTDEVARLMPPKYALLGGARLMQDQVSNLPAEFLEIEGGGTIQVLSAQAELMQCMQSAAMQRAETYRIEGISEDSAEGTTPANLDSGKAQLVHRDSNAERHVELIQRVEEFTCALCRAHIDCCEDIVETEGGKRLVVHTGGKLLDEIAYTDVSLGDNPYVVRVAPINKFANSPEGKHTQLLELANAGKISDAEFRELYDLPDLDRSNDLEFVGRDVARRLIDAALDGKRAPCPRFCDKQSLLTIGWQEYAMASQLYGASDEDLEPLLDLLGSAQTLIDEEIAQQQAQMAAAAPPPGAPSVPPPMPPDAPVPPPVPPTGPIGLVS